MTPFMARLCRRYDALLYVDDLFGRGRDAPFEAPPAQIRACAANALGSYLGFWSQIAIQAMDEEFAQAEAIDPGAFASAAM
jgi:hypothetical protein